MVVAHKHDVEARNIAGYVQRGILPVFAAHQQGVLSGMEHTDYNIGTLLFADYLHPLAGGLFHVVKTKSPPQILGEPHRNGGRYHAENGNLHSVALQHLVGPEVGFARSGIDDVGAQHRSTAVARPTVENGTSRLYIVVAHIGGIIAHEVQHIGGYVERYRVDVVIVIGGGLALQDVAVVQQNQVVLIGFARFLHKCVHACQASGGLPLKDEIVGIEITVDITGLYYFQFYFFILRSNCSNQQEHPRKTAGQSFHFVVLLMYKYHV